MTISRVSFEVGYKKLEASFGTSINKRRLDAYFEELEQVLTEASWSDIVRKVVRTHDAFPKLSDLLAMVEPDRRGERQDPGSEFINDDCKVVECQGGVISYENAGYTTAARCPKCERGPGGLPKYRGIVTLRSDEEMITRRQEREEIVRDARIARRTSAKVEAAAEEVF